MPEKTIPWWRKALSYALDGIRSGFGLFSRPAKPTPQGEYQILHPSVAPKGIEEALDHPSPQLEEPAAEPGIEVDQASAAEPIAEPTVTPGVARIDEVEEAVVIETVAEPAELIAKPAPADGIALLANPPAETRVEPALANEEASSPEFVPELAQQVEPEPEPALDAVAEPEPVDEPDLPSTVESSAAIEPVEPFAEPASTEEVDSEPVADPIGSVYLASEHSEPEPEAEPETEPEADGEAEAEVEFEDSSASESAPSVETEAEAIDLPGESPVETEDGALELEEMVIEPEAIAVPGAPVETALAPEHVPAIEMEPEIAAENDGQPEELSVEGEVEQTVPMPVGDAEAEAIQADVAEPEGTVEETTAVEIAATSEPVAEAELEAEVAAVADDQPAEIDRPEETAAESEVEKIEQVALEREPEANSEPEAMHADVTEPEAIVEGVAEAEPATEIGIGTDVAPVATAIAEQPAVPAEEPAPQLVLSSKPLIKLESRDNEADLSPFSVIVDQVYDGPLDLLLDLIRKQDIDIYDIPIARITAQFLAYVNQLKATDVDVAGEFIYIASLLIHIKSKMLLPRSPSGPDDAAEDPRRELVERLLEHERFKNAAQMLQQKQMLEAATWTNPGFREFRDDADAEPEIAADTVDLVRIFRDILERARNRPILNVEEDSVTVGQMIQFLARRLTMEDKPVALRKLLSHTRSERALIAMFLALLELVRLQAVLLRQDLAFSEIFIKKHTNFESVMNEGLANAQDDWR